MKGNVQRMAGTPLSDEERAQLRSVATMPDERIDFSDIPERVYLDDSCVPAVEVLPLEEHTLTLKIDAEVAAWLEQSAKADPNRLNWLLKRAVERSREISSTLRKAS